MKVRIYFLIMFVNIIKIHDTYFVKQAPSIMLWRFLQMLPRARVRTGAEVGVAPVDEMVHAGLGWRSVGMGLAPRSRVRRVTFLPGGFLWSGAPLTLFDGGHLRDRLVRRPGVGRGGGGLG